MSAKPSRTRNKPQQHAERLLAILQPLATATSPDLRERLQQAIAALKERVRDAGAR
jgi:hypothetical protein